MGTLKKNKLVDLPSKCQDLPSFPVKVCRVPEVVNGNTSETVGSWVDYNTEIQVVCNTGYTLPNNTQPGLQCGADGQFGVIPECTGAAQVTHLTISLFFLFIYDTNIKHNEKSLYNRKASFWSMADTNI